MLFIIYYFDIDKIPKVFLSLKMMSFVSQEYGVNIQIRDVEKNKLYL